MTPEEMSGIAGRSLIELGRLGRELIELSLACNIRIRVESLEAQEKGGVR